MIGKINQSTVDELKTVTIADSCKESFGAVIGIWVQSMIFDLITIIIKGSVSVMCYMRAMQLYVIWESGGQSDLDEIVWDQIGAEYKSIKSDSHRGLSDVKDAKAKQAVHVNDDRKNDAVALDMQEK